MNRKVLALLVPALLVAGAANAAEIYNKNGNKLDLYGKVDGLRYFSDNAGDDGDQSYARIGFKGETQINDMLTGYGQWEYNIKVNTTEGEGANSWTRLGFAGLKFGEYGSFDYGRNYGVIYDIEAWTVGAKYDAYNVYLAAMYAETRNMTYYGGGDGGNGGIANKTQNFEVVAQYQFDFGLRPSIAYLQSKGKDLGGQDKDSRGNYRYTDKDLVKYVDVGMTYYFNKNMSTYVDYKINLLDEDDDFYANNGIATDDIVGVGLVYQF